MIWLFVLFSYSNALLLAPSSTRDLNKPNFKSSTARGFPWAGKGVGGGGGGGVLKFRVSN